MNDDIVWVSNNVRACEIFMAVAQADTASMSLKFLLPFFVISFPWIFRSIVLLGYPNNAFRCLSSEIFLLYISSKRTFISMNSGGKSTSIFSNSNSWRYGFTSGLDVVRISTALIPRFSQTCVIVSLSLPGEAVNARTLPCIACSLYFCATRLYA